MIAVGGSGGYTRSSRTIRSEANLERLSLASIARKSMTPIHDAMDLYSIRNMVKESHFHGETGKITRYQLPGQSTRKGYSLQNVGWGVAVFLFVMSLNVRQKRFVDVLAPFLKLYNVHVLQNRVCKRIDRSSSANTCGIHRPPFFLPPCLLSSTDKSQDFSRSAVSCVRTRIYWLSSKCAKSSIL